MTWIRADKINLDEQRYMQWLYPDVPFDWKRITLQLAQRRDYDRCRYDARRGPLSAPAEILDNLLGRR